MTFYLNMSAKHSNPGGRYLKPVMNSGCFSGVLCVWLSLSAWRDVMSNNRHIKKVVVIRFIVCWF